MYRFFRSRKKITPVFLLGFILCLAMHLAIRLDGNQDMIRKGDMTPGHENLACAECHRPADGSFRQQIQAEFKHAVGLRETGADVITAKVQMNVCKDCHYRPDDRHPVSRFLEPRFDKARSALHPENCLSCHVEHQGERFTLDKTGLTFCKNCHSETIVADDPLDVSHEELITGGKWETCLQCHDFHGTHLYETPSVLKDTIPLKQIIDYMGAGRSPYGDEKTHKAPDSFFIKK